MLYWAFDDLYGHRVLNRYGCARLCQRSVELHQIVDINEKLERIISARLRLQKFSSRDINKVNMAIIRVVLEVARVSRFIVKVLSAQEMEKDRTTSWKLTPKLQQLLISTSVKRIGD
jgi:hypothetical protein